MLSHRYVLFLINSVALIVANFQHVFDSDALDTIRIMLRNATQRLTTQSYYSTLKSKRKRLHVRYCWYIAGFHVCIYRYHYR